MKTSSNGRKLITEFEGCKLKAYPDPGTGGAPWTVGVGHTSMAGPPNVTPGLTITAAEADAILTRDLGRFEAAVSRLVRVPLTQNQFDALVSFTFNVGEGNLGKSTLLKRVNAGDFKGAAASFAAWNKAAGRVLTGLTRRRAAEAKLFATAPAAPFAVAPAPAPISEAALPKPDKPGLISFILSLFRKVA